MADAVSTKTIFKGTRDVVMRFTNISDGTGESGVTKIDISTFSLTPGDGSVVNSIVIDKIEYNSFGMAVKIYVDHTSDETLAVLQGFGCIDLRDAGGIQTSGTGDTGDILFSTIGHTSGDTYDITIHFHLKN